MSTAVTPRDFPEIRWHGHWIWVPEEPVKPSGFRSAGVDPQAKEAHGLFRRTVRLGHVPDRAPARITADSRYALFVNGQEVSRGPIRSQPRRLYYDLVDLAPYLQPGANLLAVYVKYYGRPTSFWMPAVPNMTLGKSGILVFEADLGAAGWLISDGSWKVHKAEAWSEIGSSHLADHVGGGIPIELFDARRFPHAWHTAEFDDQHWGSAQVVPAVHIGGFARTSPPSDPYGPLYPRPIAALGGTLKLPAAARIELLAGQVDATLD